MAECGWGWGWGSGRGGGECTWWCGASAYEIAIAATVAAATTGYIVQETAVVCRCADGGRRACLSRVEPANDDQCGFCYCYPCHKVLFVTIIRSLVFIDSITDIRELYLLEGHSIHTYICTSVLS